MNKRNSKERAKRIKSAIAERAKKMRLLYHY